MPKVTFANSGDSGEAEDGAPLKDVTKDHGWPIAYGCEDGVCGTCIISVPEGKENLSEQSDQEKQTLEIMGLDDGEHRLCCQCKVKGDVTIEGM